MRKPDTWTKWRGLVAAQERGEQSVAAFCGARGISRTHFFAWKRRLSTVAREACVAVRVNQPAPVRTTEVHPGGYRVMVEPGFIAAHQRAALAVLEGRV